MEEAVDHYLYFPELCSVASAPMTAQQMESIRRERSRMQEDMDFTYFSDWYATKITEIRDVRTPLPYEPEVISEKFRIPILSWLIEKFSMVKKI